MILLTTDWTGKEEDIPAVSVPVPYSRYSALGLFLVSRFSLAQRLNGSCESSVPWTVAALDFDYSYLQGLYSIIDYR